MELEFHAPSPPSAAHKLLLKSTVVLINNSGKQDGRVMCFISNSKVLFSEANGSIFNSLF